MFPAPFSRQASHIFLEAGGEIGRSAESHPVADFGDAVTPVFQKPARLLEPYLADEIKGSIREDKKPSIRKGQKWIVDGLLFSEQAEQTGFCSTWICKRLWTEVYLHKKDVIETFGIEALSSISMQIDIK